jgi:hypothetical protein
MKEFAAAFRTALFAGANDRMLGRLVERFTRTGNGGHAMRRMRNATRTNMCRASSALVALSLVAGCGTVEEDPSAVDEYGELKSGTSVLKTLEAESGTITGAGNASQGPAAPGGWALFQDKGTVCWG